ncbi:hypothetical protein [Streptosporangium carneum]|uniref:Uncharacterized protein n=1 Tax=Streptosporangium carneum TaxID=47481 RepID=A0A9W6MCT4_9ACTN|nr:hypothetical protein [Streptosporangium carneum]GLK09506.1 hypothetical protein GCM10017600_29120 [Streptosporangium carneum]
MLVAAAVCPHPPLLVPELAGAAAPELDALRTACAAALDALRDAAPDVIVAVGGADRAGVYGAGAAGSLAAWGADVRVGAGEPVLPLSLTIGRWLLEAAGLDAAEFHAVPFDASQETCAALGARLAEGHGRVAMLVTADGSACLTEKSPGYLDPRAMAYNTAIVEALSRAEAPSLDPGEAAELWVAGRAALQVLAGAGAGAGAGVSAGAGSGAGAGSKAGAGAGVLRGEILYDDAPYGVGYFVATLVRETPGTP